MEKFTCTRVTEKVRNYLIILAKISKIFDLNFLNLYHQKIVVYLVNANSMYLSTIIKVWYKLYSIITNGFISRFEVNIFLDSFFNHDNIPTNHILLVNFIEQLDQKCLLLSIRIGTF